ncbi:MAG: hypothetical protein ABI723_14610 [Bacteroidia bacterium]
METEKKKIVYSKNAEQAIFEMLDYISIDSVNKAERIQKEITIFI